MHCFFKNLINFTIITEQAITTNTYHSSWYQCSRSHGLHVGGNTQYWSSYII